MSAPPASAADRLSPHRGLPARPGRSGRVELTAAIGVAAVLAQLLFAQATLILAVCAVVTGRVSRWRPGWLAVPAAAGTLWASAIGPGRAGTGFVAGPGQVAVYLAGLARHPARLLHLSAAFSGAQHWVPRQLPLALLAAAAEAAILAWGRQPGRRGPAAGLSPRPGYRPGLVHAILRHRTAAALSGGSVVSRAGCRLGLDTATGRPAGLSWADALGGVLVTGAQPEAAARTGFPLAWAALRRRKSVIVIDLTGSASLAGSLAAVSPVGEAQLLRFSPAGPSCYEPFPGCPPVLVARLVARLVDWTGLSQGQQQAGRRYLGAACAVLAAAPAAGPPGPILDRLSLLLEPAALRQAMSAVPGQLPHRDALARRVAAAADRPAEAAMAAVLHEQLDLLRASAFGRWLRAPASATGQAVSLEQVVRDRGGAAFSLDCGVHGAAAAMVGRLAVADLTAVLRDLRHRQLRADCLAWIHGCDQASRPAIAELAALGPPTGTAVVLSTASAAAAARLAPGAGVVVTAGPAGPALAGQVAALAEPRHEGARQAVADLLRWQDEDEFAVLTRGRQRRFQLACRSVAAP